MEGSHGELRARLGLCYASVSRKEDVRVMRFLTTRELHNRPSYFQELAKDDELVLTASGNAIAILVGIEDGDFEETVRTIRQVRAQRALSRLRDQAAQRSLSRIPRSAIEAEIAAARARRKRA